MSPGAGNEISLVVGLGNPDREYLRTRHNAGFMIADSLCASLRTRTEKAVRGGTVWAARFAGRGIHILKPTTYMNLSGEAVKSFLETNAVMPSEMLLIYDDIDIPLGRIRLSWGGGTAGHNGVESVVQSIGTADFARLRAGIGVEDSQERTRKDFVLSEFPEDEMGRFAGVVEMAVEAVRLVLSRGLGKAMNDFNGLDLDVFKENCVKKDINGGSDLEKVRSGFHS